MIRAGGPQEQNRKEQSMAVAKVSEITSTSSKSFADAIEKGIKRADKTLNDALKSKADVKAKHEAEWDAFARQNYAKARISAEQALR